MIYYIGTYILGMFVMYHIVMYLLSYNLDRTIDMFEQLRDEQTFPASTISVYFEQYENLIYAYNAKTNAYMGRGNDVDVIMDELMSVHVGKTFEVVTND